MRISKLKNKIGRFFKDKNGKWTIIQFPNALLFIWIVLTIVLWVIGQSEFVAILRLFQAIVLVSWALLEFIDGDSYFRRTLGLLILVMVPFGIFL